MYDDGAGIGHKLRYPVAITSLNDYLAVASRGGTMRWPAERSKLTVFIRPGESEPGYKREYDGFCRQAFAEWSKASDGRLALEFVRTPEHADIDWEWTANRSKVSYAAEAGTSKRR